jgi:predicted component of type VI protein secretion system
MFFVLRQLTQFLVNRTQKIHFFEAMRLLEYLISISKKSHVKTIIFSASGKNDFFHSVIKTIHITADTIAIDLNLAAFLTQKYATFFLRLDKSLASYLLNRFIWLYYKCFKKSHPMLSSAAFNSTPDVLDYLLCHMIGVQSNKENYDNYHTYREYISVLFNSQYSLQVLEQILASYFEIPIKVKLLLVQKITQPCKNRKYLTLMVEQQSVYLNHIFLGYHAYVSNRRLQIIITLLKQKYYTFLPNGIEVEKLMQFLKYYLPIHIDLMISLKVSLNQFIHCRLFSDENKKSYYLGWTCYLFKREYDRHDFILIKQLS